MDYQLTDRNKLIEQLKLQILQFDIKPNELFTPDQAQQVEQTSSKPSHNIITKLLYYTGGILLIAGVIFWIAVNWDNYTDFSKVLIMLGTPIVLYVMAYILEKSYMNLGEIAVILYILASILLPGGLAYSYAYATNYASPKNPEYIILGIFSVYSIILFTLSLQSKFKDYFTVFQIVSLTVIYTTLAYIVSPRGGPYYASFVSTVLGVIYISASMYFQNINKRLFIILMHILSLISFLIGVNIAAAEANWASAGLFICIFISISFIYLSLKNKSTLTLLISTVTFIASLIGYIVDVFGDFASWPVLVILSGIIVITCGYYSLRLQQKYIKNQIPA